MKFPAPVVTTLVAWLFRRVIAGGARGASRTRPPRSSRGNAALIVGILLSIGVVFLPALAARAGAAAGTVREPDFDIFADDED